jgi:hypothetical protein
MSVTLPPRTLDQGGWATSENSEDLFLLLGGALLLRILGEVFPEYNAPDDGLDRYVIGA